MTEFRKVRRVVDGKRQYVKEPVSPDKAAKLTTAEQIAQLTKDRDQFRNWWHQDRNKVELLHRKIKRLEASLISIRMLSTATLPDLDDEIPF